MFKRIFFVCILLLLFVTNCFSGHKIDSLTNQLYKPLPPKTRLIYLLELAKVQIEFGDRDCIHTAEVAQKLADSLRLEPEKAEALKLQGITSKIWGNTEQSITYLYEALNIFEKLQMQPEYADVLMNIGEAQRTAGNFDKSMMYLGKALKISLKYNNSENLAKIYGRLAATGYELYFYTVSYNEKRATLDKEKNFFQLMYSTDTSFRREYLEVANNINLSIHYANKVGLPDVKISSHIILGALYMITSQFDKAMVVYQGVLDEIGKTEVKTDLPLVLYDIALLYYKKHDYDSAMIYAKNSYRIAKDVDIKQYIILGTELLETIYLELGDYKEAYYYIKLRYESRMTYYQNDINMKMRSMQLDNEIGRKQKEIDFRNKQLLIMVVFIVVIIILTLAFMMVLIKKNKRQKLLNAELNAKNQIIVQQMEKLEELGKEKDKLFSILAHDLRGPFNIFLGYTELLAERLPTLSIAAIHGLAVNMQKSAKSLYRLLENLLQWSRMQQGALSFDPEALLLSDLVEESLSTIRESAFEKQIDISSNVPDSLKVYADKNMLLTVMRNLVSNAVKFTPKRGSIKISAVESQDNHIEISVLDTGIGMNADILGRLFQLNHQTIRKGTMGESSTGLGVLLCKEFIEKNGGKLWVTSEENGGSIFTFSLQRVP